VPGIDVLFFYGGSEVALHGRDLYVAAKDDFWSIGHKTLATFEWAVAERDFDLIFRTNSSSYVDLANLRGWVDEHARATRFYAGVLQAPLGMARRDEILSARLADGGRLAELMHTPHLDARTPQLDREALAVADWSFASGAGYFLSRDLVEWIVEHGALWDHELPDDMSVGRLLAAHGVAPEPAPREVMDTLWTPATIDTSNFLFRCRTASSWRRGDIDVMLRVDAALADERGETHTRWYTRRRRLKLALRRAQRLVATARPARRS
jgi:hypothetical protein